MPHTPSTPNTPSARLGTRLAQELLNTDEPYAHLTRAQNDGDPRLRHLTGLVTTMISELDQLDHDTETQHRNLTDRIGDTCTHPHAVSVRTTVLRLEEACAARDRTATFLRRLLICYRAATTPDTSPANNAS